MQQRRFNIRQEKDPLNWRRGMFRLWVLASSAWVMGWGIFFAIRFMSGEYSDQQLPVVPVVLMGPPFALFLFGIGAIWALRGFEVDDPDENVERNSAPTSLRQDNKRFG